MVRSTDIRRGGHTIRSLIAPSIVQAIEINVLDSELAGTFAYKLSLQVGRDIGNPLVVLHLE